MSVLKFAGALLFAAFVSVDAAELVVKCPNGENPPACFVDPCAHTVCTADSVCVPNICDSFPTAGKGACTATCVSIQNTCPLRVGLGSELTHAFRCGSGTAFPGCTNGCNACGCEAGDSTVCTHMACITLAQCQAGGQQYATGSMIPASLAGSEKADGNVCLCSGYGRWVCSDLPAPAPAAPAAAAETCPDGSSPAQCLIDPCSTMHCKANQFCLPNYCNGFPSAGAGPCTAKCVDGPITARPPRAAAPAAAAAAGASTCPDGSSPAQCFVNPCASVTCATGTVCVANYCNGFPTAGNGPCTAACVARLNTATGGACPPESPPVQCLVDPCQSKNCGINAHCVADYCGGCHATCVVNSASPLAAAAAAGAFSCPPDAPPVQCLVDPCRNKNCGINAHCVADYCGGCHATCVVNTVGAAAAASAAAGNTCPDGSSQAQCLRNPCQGVSCESGKQCVANYCNGFPVAGQGVCTGTCV